MPLDPIENRRPPITPQLALRVAGFGVVAFILFGIIFFRLWYLQVLDGDRYLAQARENRVRTERIQAPRGDIVDRNGNALVLNRRANVLSIDPRTISSEFRTSVNGWGKAVNDRAKRPEGKRGPKVPMPAPDPALALLERRLARVLRISPATVHERIVSKLVQVPFADVRVETDVDGPQSTYIEEHQELFPGVKVDQIYVRRYPYGTLAAQLLGYVGEIGEKQVGTKPYAGVAAGTYVGKDGIEDQYDRYLRGTDGAFQISVNALGERQRAVTARQPKQGRQVRLTLDLALQQTGENALRSIGAGKSGAFVAMDPNDGRVFALGSAPSYKPSDLALPLTEKQYEEKFGEAAGRPLFNNAIAGGYLTGSTFKPVTALAGLASGVTTPSRVINDTGCLQVGKLETDVKCNAKKEAHGRVDLRQALSVSSDVYFYQLSLELFAIPGLPLQTWAHKLGLGRKTGIDLPGEQSGVVPGPEFRNMLNRKEAACRKEKGRPCGIADGTNRPWQGGDEANLSIGQGDLSATPLQMARVYAALANGGKLVRPHLGQSVQDSDGRFLQDIPVPKATNVKINPEWTGTIMAGLRDAASADGGTSTAVFQGWPHNRYAIAGKTGTVERDNENDSAWYVAYAYDVRHPKQKPIVIAATIEKGGFGAETAAPMVARMLAKWFGVDFTPNAGTPTPN